MKKLVAIITISVFTMSCNNSSSETNTEVTPDSTITESPLMDAVNTADSAGKAIEAVKDSLVK